MARPATVPEAGSPTRADDAAAAGAQWLRPEPSPWPMRVLALAVALLVVGPGLAPGFVLQLDMVFVPRQDLDLDALGLGGTLPRAVPVDAVLALLTALVQGALVQKAVLLAAVSAAVLGAARLVPPDRNGNRGLAAPVAGLVYGWSPYLAERLLLGHWSLLVAYAALPWIALAGLALRAGRRGALPRLALACAAAALTPTGAVLAAGVAVAASGLRRAWLAGGVVASLSLPWLVAGALHPSGGTSDPDGVAAFAARAENWAGAVVSVLGTGGVWNAAAVPASRASALVPVVTLMVLAVAAYGWFRTRTLHGPARGLVVLGALGVLLACAATVPGPAAVLGAVVDAVPGAGLLRDGQKWAAWWALPLAIAAGLGARGLMDGARRRAGAAAAGVVCAAVLVVPVVTMPDLAWGVGGRLEAVDHPGDWQRVRAALADDERPGSVLVVPFGAYRSFHWNDGRTVLDPAARWLPRPVVTDDTLVVGDVVVEGEDPRARSAGELLDRPRELAREGIGWVLVEHGTPGRVPEAIADLPVDVAGPDLTLHRVPGAVLAEEPAPVRVTLVVVAHALAAGVVVISALWIIVGASTVTRRRRPLRKRDRE